MLLGLFMALAKLRYMLHKMGRVKLPSCRKFGTEKETLVHILCECWPIERVKGKTLGRAELDQIIEMRLSGVVALGRGTRILSGR